MKTQKMMNCLNNPEKEEWRWRDSAHVTANLLCQHDWGKGIPDMWLSTVSGQGWGREVGVSGRD